MESLGVLVDRGAGIPVVVHGTAGLAPPASVSADHRSAIVLDYGHDRGLAHWSSGVVTDAQLEQTNSTHSGRHQSTVCS